MWTEERFLWDRRRVCRSSLIWVLPLPWPLMNVLPVRQIGKYVENSVARTTRWLVRCKEEMARLNSLEDTVNPHQLLFGINQGAVYDDIRIAHAQEISKLDLDGYAIGGLAVGETHEEMYRILEQCGSLSSGG